MKIVVAVRCYNNVNFVERFLRGYDFADDIVISDGGSTDGSVEAIKSHDNPKIHLLNFSQTETINGVTWNLDSPHMNFVLDYAKSLQSDWLLFDDFDCVPNKTLREDARAIFEHINASVQQVNVFRLYLWGDTEYFPHMNRDFHPDYRSVWAWKPKEVDIHADPNVRHGTLIGLVPSHGLGVPYCLLHKSWHPDTIQAKIDRYNAVGLPHLHPLDFAGKPEPLPTWATE